jgi:hypothetical protein
MTMPPRFPDRTPPPDPTPSLGGSVLMSLAPRTTPHPLTVNSRTTDNMVEIDLIMGNL